MLSTWSKGPTKVEIYGDLAAKATPSKKAMRDIWIAPSHALTISVDVEVIGAQASQNQLEEVIEVAQVILTSWRLIGRNRRSRLVSLFPVTKRHK